MKTVIIRPEERLGMLARDFVRAFWERNYYIRKDEFMWKKA